MPLPEGITRQYVEQAIAQIDGGASHPFGPSVDYDLVFQGKAYPPKAVLGLAASLATGTQYGPNDFSGGEGHGQANSVLRSLGFEVVRKDGPVATRGIAAPSSPVWLEMTQSSHDHGGPGWEFGTCLWSPSKNRSGHDWYRIMRDPQVGDTVIHCLDSSLVGESIVEQPCREVQETPPSPGPWEGLAPYYRVDLRDYRAFATPCPLADLEREYHDEILQDLKSNEPSRYPFFATATGGLRTVQGGYLTRCTPELTRIIVEAVGAAAASTPVSPIPRPRPAGARYWCIAAGEEGRLWPEYQKQQIVTIGWDQLGDLREYSDKERLVAKLRETRADDTFPTNAALACYEFVHGMNRGDFVIAKRGISDILGFGEVESDYEFLAERPEHRNIRRVRWLTVGHWQLPDDRTVPQKTLTDVTDNRALLDYILPLFERTPGTPTPELRPLYTVNDAMSDLFLDRDAFVHLLTGLSRKKNLIIEGPPGVGKSFVARRLAYARIGYKDPTRLGAVQLHQSYAYEDFVQGWRPTETGGFTLRDGVFYEFCDRARGDASVPYVFIIDEINRGNISKVFGELLMLLEPDKRGPEFAVPLTYATDPDDLFFVPENVHVIGLMNTADRSLAMVDYALRRRFIFGRLYPAFHTPQFRSYLLDRGAEPTLIDLIVTRLTALNEVIASDRRNLGPGFEIGHSFFCPSDAETECDRAWYETVIRFEIEPLLREYWFEDSDKVADLVGDLLR